MSTINFTCPQCSHTMQLPATAEGRQGKCPSCNAVVTITASHPPNQLGTNTDEVQVAHRQPEPASPEAAQHVQQQAPSVASPTPQLTSKPRKSRWKLLCVTHILAVALTIGLMPYWKPHLEPFFPSDYLAQNSTEAATSEPKVAAADNEKPLEDSGMDEDVEQRDGDNPGNSGPSVAESVTPMEKPVEPAEKIVDAGNPLEPANPEIDRSQTFQILKNKYLGVSVVDLVEDLGKPDRVLNGGKHLFYRFNAIDKTTGANYKHVQFNLDSDDTIDSINIGVSDVFLSPAVPNDNSAAKQDPANPEIDRSQTVQILKNKYLGVSVVDLVKDLGKPDRVLNGGKHLFYRFNAIDKTTGANYKHVQFNLDSDDKVDSINIGVSDLF